MAFICISAAVYIIAAVLLRKTDKEIISRAVCIFLPLIVTIIMVTSSKTPSNENVGRAGGLFALLVFMIASVPTLTSISNIRELITAGREADRKTVIKRIAAIVVCVPLSIWINHNIAKPLWFYMHHMTILTYILLAASAAGAVYLVYKGSKYNNMYY